MPAPNCVAAFSPAVAWRPEDAAGAAWFFLLVNDIFFVDHGLTRAQLRLPLVLLRRSQACRPRPNKSKTATRHRYVAFIISPAALSSRGI